MRYFPQNAPPPRTAQQLVKMQFSARAFTPASYDVALAASTPPPRFMKSESLLASAIEYASGIVTAIVPSASDSSLA